jgi:hypothetical protein
MFWHNLIFSDLRSYRITRHVLFWTIRLFFVLTAKYISLNVYNGVAWPLKNHLILCSAVRLLEAFYCYAVIYWLLPKYLVKEKYISFAFWLLLKLISI